jgi:menaquinone-specific isochorismate synthase
MDVMEVEMAATAPTPIRSVVLPLHRRLRLIDTLRLAGDQARIFWQNGQLTTAYAGWGVTASLTASGPERFSRLRAEVETLLSCVEVEGVPRDAAPRMFGGFSFRDDFMPHQTWRRFPNTYFVLPRVMITDTDGQLWLTITGCDAQEDLHSEAARIASQLEALQITTAAQQASIVETTYPLPREAWRDGVNEAVQRINDGELQKVVLSRTGEIRFDRPVDVIPALERLSQRYPSTYRFLFEPQKGAAFMGATPELLIEVADRRVRTAAVAGSIGRGANEREDAELAAELFTSTKERHEHGLVADALRDLLEPMASQLTYPDEPQILKLGNIQHLYTPFDGVLRSHLDVLDAVEKLHPTPALGGCPQQAAVAAIREIETVDRGWFASPVGWIDGCGNGMLAVAIRSAVIDGDTARLYAGCGIVAQSNPDSEWEETRIKFRPMLDALGAEGAL